MKLTRSRCVPIIFARFAKFYNGATFSVQSCNIEAPPKPCKGDDCRDWSQLTSTTAVIYRGNCALSNGGFNIANGQPANSIRDIVIDGNSIALSDPDKAMQISPVLLNTTCVARRNVLP